MTDKEKIKIYEELLHRIQIYAEVTMDNEKLSKLLRNICNWSYSHRVGNGCLTQEEQNELIKESFEKLLRVD